MGLELCQLETFENGAIPAKSKQGDTRTGRQSQETNTIQTLLTNTLQTLHTNTNLVRYKYKVTLSVTKLSSAGCSPAITTCYPKLGNKQIQHKL